MVSFLGGLNTFSVFYDQAEMQREMAEVDALVNISMFGKPSFCKSPTILADMCPS